jgi:hypothetical protein
MARSQGYTGYIEAGDTPVEVGERLSWSIDFEVEELDANTQGTSGWGAIEAGLKNATVSLECFHDETDSGQTLLTLGETVTISLYPTGDASGKTEYTGDWVVTKVSPASGVGDLVKVNYTFRNDGVIATNTVT